MATYSKLVESLKRLYNGGVNPRVSLEKLQTMKSEGTLSDDEYNYIIGK